MTELPIASSHTSCVGRVPIFAALTPAQQDAVAGYARPVEVAAGEQLHGVGASLSRLFVLHRGSVRTIRPTGLAAYLLGLPADPVEGGYRVRLPMAKKDIASYLGTTPESLSRGLRRLQTAGFIAVRSRSVDLLDPAALEALEK